MRRTMKIRKISLTQLHAINWYGYADSMPVEGNLLFAGVTGSGKSILMDLLQFVLIGDRRLVKFNQSATGERSGRDLKSYVLGDLKEEEGGVEQYMRSSAITYAALEFTWPDGKRVETWGLRVEFASVSEQHGRISPWWCEGRLTRGDFLTVTADDKRIPRELADWRRVVEERGGEIFHGIEEYRRDMSSVGHLNFDHGILSRLLPTAMSFTFLKSFNEFCRLFILPPDRLNVTDVTSSYRTFQRYEEELVELRRQLEALHEIHVLYESHIAFDRDAAICRYLAAECAQQHAITIRDGLDNSLKELRSAAGEETARLQKLGALIPQRREEISALERSIGESPDGKLYLHLKAENKTLSGQIGLLRETGTTLESAFALRIRFARKWATDAAELPFKIDTSAVERATERAELEGLPKAEDNLRALCDAGNRTSSDISRAARQNAERLAVIRKDLGALRDEVSALKLGRLPFPTRALDALNNALPATSGAPVAQHLCQLCEVKDERWRAAIEVAFTRKFAVVVPPEHYDQAEGIYYALRGEQSRERESLVNPHKALKLTRFIKPGSLAEKIETNHPVAGALVSHLFGDLMCCEQREQLRDHNLAILPDGFSTRGAFVERARHYDNLPFVGKRGLEQQRIWKETQITKLAAEERTLEPIETAVGQVQREAKAQFEDSTPFYKDLLKIAELPTLEKKLSDNIAQLNSIDRAKFDDLEKGRIELLNELGLWEGEERRLLQSQKHKDVERAEKELAVAITEETRAEDKFSGVACERDFSAWLPRIDELRNGMISQYPAMEVAARRFEAQATDMSSESKVTREKLCGARRLFIQRYPKFDDMPVDAMDNAAFERVLAKIEDAEIPSYEQKAKDERAKWEHLFRTQILEKLRAALSEVKNILSLLNSALNKPIGTNRYFIHHAANPDYRIYHEMLSATSASGSDLFASISDEQLRETIQQFLKMLIESPDSVQAGRLLDYRCYYEYDMLVEDTDLADELRRRTSVDKYSDMFSGGENQSPYFIAILASYLRAYRRQGRYQDSPTLALVPIDEAFSKLSGERISDCIKALAQLDLQGVFSMSTGNIPYAFEQCDHLLVVSKEERRVGRKLRVRNIAVSIARESEKGRQFMQNFE